LNSTHLPLTVNRFKGKFVIAWRLLTVSLCLTQMLYVGLEFSRHWSAMGPYTHAYGIILLSGYAVPCLHLFKKEPNPFVIALLMYGLLAVAAFLVFPLIP